VLTHDLRRAAFPSSSSGALDEVRMVPFSIRDLRVYERANDAINLRFWIYDCRLNGIGDSEFEIRDWVIGNL
jgi:hypothetical protein